MAREKKGRPLLRAEPRKGRVVSGCSVEADEPDEWDVKQNPHPLPGTVGYIVTVAGEAVLTATVAEAHASRDVEVGLIVMAQKMARVLAPIDGPPPLAIVK